MKCANQTLPTGSNQPSSIGGFSASAAAESPRLFRCPVFGRSKRRPSPATQSSRKSDHPNEKSGTNAAQSSTITGVQTDLIARPAWQLFPVRPHIDLVSPAAARGADQARAERPHAV